MTPRISVVLPILAPTQFLRDMAEFAIKTLRQHADNREFELIVCEATYAHFDPHFEDGVRCVNPLKIDKYLGFIPPIGGVREINAGIDVAKGEFILFFGTDIVAPQGWDTELLRLFERKDCGAASLSAFEPNATVGPPGFVDLVVEGIYSPFTMFRKGWRYDEAYLRIYQDSDLIMRMYEQGLRAYRSCRKHVWHLGSVTNTQSGEQHIRAHEKALAHDERLFYDRWGKSPLSMFAMIRAGQQTYGREHEALLAQIPLHYDPSQPA